MSFSFRLYCIGLIRGRGMIAKIMGAEAKVLQVVLCATVDRDKKLYKVMK